MSWIESLKTKSYILYHYKGTDIVDYLATSNYYEVVATLLLKYNALTKYVEKKGKIPKISIKSDTKPELIEFELIFNEHKINIYSSIKELDIRDAKANLIAQDQLYKSDEWNGAILGMTSMLTKNEVTPLGLVKGITSCIGDLVGNENVKVLSE